MYKDFLASPDIKVFDHLRMLRLLHFVKGRFYKAIGLAEQISVNSEMKLLILYIRIYVVMRESEPNGFVMHWHTIKLTLCHIWLALRNSGAYFLHHWYYIDST